MLLALDNFEVNVQDMTAIKDRNPRERYTLVRAEKNVRQRGNESAKHYDSIFDL